MAITFLQIRQKQQILLYLLLVLVLALVAVFWFGFLRKPVPKTVLAPTVTKPEKIEINFKALDNPLLKELQAVSEVTPYTGSVGRENPFLHY